MTQEDKQLLLKDLCARLPYGMKVHITNEWFYDKIEPYDRRLDCDVIKNLRVNEYTVKPYLRPMSSMTEEEKKVFDKFVCIDEFAWNGDTEKGYLNQAIIMSDGIDWLISHHFDFRNLIEKGLAIEAPEGMYENF